jgi:hypothetical protein
LPRNRVMCTSTVEEPLLSKDSIAFIHFKISLEGSIL